MDYFFIWAVNNCFCISPSDVMQRNLLYYVIKLKRKNYIPCTVCLLLCMVHVSDMSINPEDSVEAVLQHVTWISMCDPAPTSVNVHSNHGRKPTGSISSPFTTHPRSFTSRAHTIWTDMPFLSIPKPLWYLTYEEWTLCDITHRSPKPQQQRLLWAR